MSQSNFDFEKTLKNLRRYTDDICRTAAGEIRDDLTNEAALAIESFYQSYDPIVYDRHFFNFENNSFEKYYAKSGKYYYGGVKLTPEKMSDIYQEPPDVVFDSVYSGLHGPVIAYLRAGNQLPIMSPTPLELILRKRDYITDHAQEYIDRAKQKVKW